MKYKITVVITTYNLSDSISTCLEELQNQTFSDFEIIVVDDCSKDSTREKVDGFKPLFGGRLKTIYCEKNNGTPAITRNIAMDSGMITGEYVLFLDGDDDIETDMLEKMYSTAVSENADIVVCGYNRVNASTGKEYSREMVSFYVSEITQDANEQYIPLINGALWNKLMRVSCIGSERVPAIRVGEDASFLLGVYCHAEKICFINDVLIHYSVSDGSLMSTIPEAEMHNLANEIKLRYDNADKPSYKELLVLAAFIHVGISMAVRAYQSKAIKTNAYLKWAKNYFRDSYGNNWHKTEYLRLSSLKHLGIKGYALKACVWLYRMNIMGIFLFVYDFMITKLGKDVKW